MCLRETIHVKCWVSMQGNVFFATLHEQDLVVDYTCDCPEGYFGTHCEGHRCNIYPCLNGGTCIPSTSGYECLCKNGFKVRIPSQNFIVFLWYMFGFCNNYYIHRIGLSLPTSLLILYFFIFHHGL